MGALVYIKLGLDRLQRSLLGTFAVAVFSTCLLGCAADPTPQSACAGSILDISNQAGWRAVVWSPSLGMCYRVSGKRSEQEAVSIANTSCAHAGGTDCVLAWSQASTPERDAALYAEQARQASEQARIQQERMAEKEAAERAARQEQTVFDQFMASPEPAQMFSYALRMEKQAQLDRAQRLYQAIVDRFPRSNWAEKAVDRMAALNQAQQMQARAADMQEHQMAAIQAQAKLCRTQCQDRHDACARQQSEQTLRATSTYLQGVLSQNANMFLQGAEGLTNNAACEDGLTQCQSGCPDAP